MFNLTKLIPVALAVSCSFAFVACAGTTDESDDSTTSALFKDDGKKDDGKKDDGKKHDWKDWNDDWKEWKDDWKDWNDGGKNDGGKKDDGKKGHDHHGGKTW